MGRLGTVGVVLLVSLLTGVHSAAAQDDRPTVGVGVLWSTQGSATPAQGSSMPAPGVGGTAAGISAEVGTTLTPALGFSLELSVPARFDSLQQISSPPSQINNHYRDLVLSGLFHVRVTPTGPIRIALVGGPSVIWESTLQRVADRSVSGGFGPYGSERRFTTWTLGLTGGAEIEADVSRHVAIVPQIRLHWIRRGDAVIRGDYGSAILSLGSVVIRPAAGVRVRF